MQTSALGLFSFKENGKQSVHTFKSKTYLYIHRHEKDLNQYKYIIQIWSDNVTDIWILGHKSAC